MFLSLATLMYLQIIITYSINQIYQQVSASISWSRIKTKKVDPLSYHQFQYLLIKELEESFEDFEQIEGGHMSLVLEK